MPLHRCITLAQSELATHRLQKEIVEREKVEIITYSKGGRVAVRRLT